MVTHDNVFSISQTVTGMYWGQAAVALTLAIATAYSLSERGYALATVAAAGLIVYVCLRWAFALVYRIRYWYRHGTEGYYSRTCPGCGRHVHRLSEDWILTCRRCGWRAGWPVVRWLTHSMPAREFRKTVIGPRLVVVMLAVAALTTGATAGVAIDDVSSAAPTIAERSEQSATPTPADGQEAPTPSISTDGSSTNDDRQGQGRSPTVTPTAENPGVNDLGFNETKVERLVFQYLNSEREGRDMAPLSFNSRAASAARVHAEDMAENNYFSHTSQSGETQIERYSFCDGAENAAQNWVNRRIRQDDGSIAEYTTEKELANGIVEQWMNSDPHRERGIFGDQWTSGGAGIAIAANQKVYAVFGFCST